MITILLNFFMILFLSLRFSGSGSQVIWELLMIAHNSANELAQYFNGNDSPPRSRLGRPCRSRMPRPSIYPSLLTPNFQSAARGSGSCGLPGLLQLSAITGQIVNIRRSPGGGVIHQLLIAGVVGRGGAHTGVDQERSIAGRVVSESRIGRDDPGGATFTHELPSRIVGISRARAIGLQNKSTATCVVVSISETVDHTAGWIDRGQTGKLSGIVVNVADTGGTSGQACQNLVGVIVDKGGAADIRGVDQRESVGGVMDVGGSAAIGIDNVVAPVSGVINVTDGLPQRLLDDRGAAFGVVSGS